MTTYYHVTTDQYHDGNDILCWDAYVAEYGREPGPWKWDGAEPGMIDGDTVSIFRADQLDEARKFAREWISGTAKILTIDDEDDMLNVTTNREGYASIEWSIPASLVIDIEVITKPRRKAAPVRPDIATCAHVHLGPLMDSATGREAADQDDERSGTFRICADCGAWRRY